jgi:hypothetical protein
MSKRPETEDERRSTARFVCTCDANVSRVPSDGVVVPAKILDLSLGGCCVDSALPLSRDVKVEIQVHVKGASFRVVGDVKGIRSESESCIQFVRLSAGAKEALADLIREMATVYFVVKQPMEKP